MKLDKWNRNTREYEPYEVPDDWKCKVFSNDMDEIVNCPHCGREITFGEGYTSREIHNGLGLGYIVCGKCFNEETRRESSNE